MVLKANVSNVENKIFSLPRLVLVINWSQGHHVSSNLQILQTSLRVFYPAQKKRENEQTFWVTKWRHTKIIYKSENIILCYTNKIKLVSCKNQSIFLHLKHDRRFVTVLTFQVVVFKCIFGFDTIIVSKCKQDRFLTGFMTAADHPNVF